MGARPTHEAYSWLSQGAKGLTVAAKHFLSRIINKKNHLLTSILNKLIFTIYIRFYLNQEQKNILLLKKKGEAELKKNKRIRGK